MVGGWGRKIPQDGRDGLVRPVGKQDRRVLGVSQGTPGFFVRGAYGKSHWPATEIASRTATTSQMT